MIVGVAAEAEISQGGSAGSCKELRRLLKSGRGDKRSASSQARFPLQGSRALIICHRLVIEFPRHLMSSAGVAVVTRRG